MCDSFFGEGGGRSLLDTQEPLPATAISDAPLPREEIERECKERGDYAILSPGKEGGSGLLDMQEPLPYHLITDAPLPREVIEKVPY